MIKYLKHAAFAVALVIGFSMTAAAQKKNDPPPKEKPPVIVPSPDKKPKDEKPKKPNGEFFASRETFFFE